MENKKINLFLDDLRTPLDGFVLVKNIEDALEYIRNNNIGILSLDHDLGIDEHGDLLQTGYDLVKIFCQEGCYVDEVRFHTSNPVGRDNMYKTLIAAKDRGFISQGIKIVR